MGKCLLLLLLFISSVAYAQNRKALDEKYGFRDAHFEMDTTAFADLAEPVGSKKERSFSRANDSKQIGEAKVDKIIYNFYNGKLSSINIDIKGYDNSRAVLAAFNAQYGPAAQTSSYSSRHTWHSKRVGVSYSEQADGNSRVLMYSVPMYEHQKADDKVAGKKAASDL